MMALSQNITMKKNYTNALKFAKKHIIDYDNLEIITMVAKIEANLKSIQAEKYFKLVFDKESENNLSAQNYINILLFQKKFK